MIKCKLHISLVGLLILASLCLKAQENLELYRGNSNYADGEFDEAKVHYQKAIENNPSSYKGSYNLGNTSYKQENFEDAVTIYEQAIAASKNDSEKSDAFHNLGNTHLQSGKFEESIKAYKNALRLNPSAEDSRYNLAFAKKMLEQEQEQEKEQEDKDNQDKKDEEKGDSDKEKEENQDSDKDQEEDESGENEPKDGEEKEDGQKDDKPEPKPIQLTPREAEQLLEAAKNEDQKIQMQLKKKQKGDPRKIEKDW
ncbi:tetratricopeptide repeat protein [Salibacteraceae bacterium]|nr:tetratricopeptide repeat protein [Salibacteraceae bacterium]